MVDHSRELAIRARAYQLWEESGRADGSQDQHWRQAEREMAERDAPERPEGAGVVQQQQAPGEARRHSDGVSTFRSVLDPRPET